jgi:hypothetical protein
MNDEISERSPSLFFIRFSRFLKDIALRGRSLLNVAGGTLAKFTAGSVAKFRAGSVQKFRAGSVAKFRRGSDPKFRGGSVAKFTGERRRAGERVPDKGMINPGPYLRLSARRTGEVAAGARVTGHGTEHGSRH